MAAIYDNLTMTFLESAIPWYFLLLLLAELRFALLRQRIPILNFDERCYTPLPPKKHKHTLDYVDQNFFERQSGNETLRRKFNILSSIDSTKKQFDN